MCKELVNHDYETIYTVRETIIYNRLYQLQLEKTLREISLDVFLDKSRELGTMIVETNTSKMKFLREY